MAEFRFDVSQLEKKINRLGDRYDAVCEDMLSAGANVVAGRLQRTKFGKYVKINKPKKNQYGWFAQVVFKGKTSSGAAAALAASVHEFGRGGKNPQPARPEIRPASAAAEADAVKAMEEVLNKELKSL